LLRDVSLNSSGIVCELSGSRTGKNAKSDSTTSYQYITAEGENSSGREIDSKGFARRSTGAWQDSGGIPVAIPESQAKLQDLVRQLGEEPEQAYARYIEDLR
jgi:hypothetical protein